MKVFNDKDGAVETPDSIFPNNWFSTHASGLVFIYPMLCEARRQERRTDIIDYFIRHKKVGERLSVILKV